jgi:NAD-dependent dihydropyrimidine dehydrogenase PreA subunit
MCALVCPFDAVTFHPLSEGPGPDVAVAVKCDGCVDRVTRGDTPACVEVCKVDALVFGDINNLVAAGRLREAGAVLAAAGATPSAPVGGDPLAAWRAWGGAIATAATGAAQRRPVGPSENETAPSDGTTNRPPTGGHSEGGPP